MSGELERLRRERLEAAQAEERLRDELRAARVRAEALERELEAVRASTSFRFGHAVALAVRAGTPVRAALGALRPSRPVPAPERRPDTVLFVAWGAGEERLRTLVERVERLRAILVRLRPVFVVDTPEAGPIPVGDPLEHVIALEDWRERRPPHEWSAYVADRMAAIVAEHRPLTVVVLEPDEGRSALEQGVLDALVVPQLAKGESNLLTALDPETETVAALARELAVTPARRRRRT